MLDWIMPAATTSTAVQAKIKCPHPLTPSGILSCRYSVGMALSAYQKGRMLLVSAEKAPATGCILFESVDSGRSWVNISDDVADAAAALTEHAPDVLEQTPLAMFVPGKHGSALPCVMQPEQLGQQSASCAGTNKIQWHSAVQSIQRACFSACTAELFTHAPTGTLLTQALRFPDLQVVFC